MFKNLKMRVSLTIVILTVTAFCIFILFLMSSYGMAGLLQKSAHDKMYADLNAQASLVDEFIVNQEDVLKLYSLDPLIKDYFLDPSDESKLKAVQEYTEEYYANLDNWEGVYIAELTTCIKAHSDTGFVGLVTRQEGSESLALLHRELESAEKLYNAGIIVSPATKKLILSMYCPVYDNGKIIGYAGGGPFLGNLEDVLYKLKETASYNAQYTMINVENNMYIFHEDENLIATEINNDMYLNLIDYIHNNESDEIGEISYKENGEEYIVAYRYDKNHGWAVVTSIKEKDLYSDLRNVMITLAVICVVSSFVIGFSAWLFIYVNTKPLNYVTKALLDLKKLKISKSDDLLKYKNCKSEVGQIATALDSLTDSLQSIVDTLDECSVSLTDSAKGMSDSSMILIQCVEDNSLATEVFTEHTNYINETVRAVDDGVEEIAEVVSKVEAKIKAGNEKSLELMENVSEMRDVATKSLENTNEKIKDNYEAIQKAMTDLQSLTKIDLMANRILEITNQTKLLSLNASIEAARAGEAGRGFAIVAEEIGGLASSSSETVAEIQGICNQTKQNIVKVQDCFNSIISFMEKDVKKQFVEFVDATNEYNDSITQIKDIISDMSECSEIFVKAVSDIQAQIDSVQDDYSGDTVSTEEMLGKVALTRKSSEDIADIVVINERNAVSIRDIVSRFTK